MARHTSCVDPWERFVCSRAWTPQHCTGPRLFMCAWGSVPPKPRAQILEAAQGSAGGRGPRTLRQSRCSPGSSLPPPPRPTCAWRTCPGPRRSPRPESASRFQTCPRGVVWGRACLPARNKDGDHSLPAHSQSFIIRMGTTASAYPQSFRGLARMLLRVRRTLNPLTFGPRCHP